MKESERMAELEALIAEQAADDTTYVEPERFGAGGVRVMSVDRSNLGDRLSDALDGESRPVSGARSNDDAPGLVSKFKQTRTESLFPSSTENEDPRTELVREVLEQCTPEQQETFRLVYGERLSIREAGERLGITHVAVLSRLETIKARVTRALVSAASPEGEPS